MASLANVWGDFIEIYEDDRFSVYMCGDQNAPNVFLSFTDLDQGLGGIQALDFVGSTCLPGFSAIFITDKRRSWFNDFTADELLDPIKPLVSGKAIHTIGNSLGGFGAIWVTRHLPVKTAIAFCPQFSVRADIVPEVRWAEFSSAVTCWRVPSLAGCFMPRTRYYTFNGRQDELQWRQIARFPGHHLLVEEAQHDAAAVIKNAGNLHGLIRGCVEGADFSKLDRIANVRMTRLLSESPPL